jgi:hypothetical protein
VGLRSVNALALRLAIVGVALWLSATAPARAQLLSPGALTKAHAALEGDANCQRCHASKAGVSEPRCLDCHRDIGEQKRRGTGLHGAAFRGQRCGQCHAEHLGSGVSLVRWPGPDASRFDHRQTGWPLRDAHARARCSECHDRRNERGARTFLGLEQRCSSCHEDPHQGRFGERCGDCHGESSFERLDLSAFDHDLARFPLEGAHERVGCADCHGKPPQYEKLAFSDCASCHEDPHAGELKGGCKSCHTVDRWRTIVMPRKLHPGLSLAGGHQTTACASCHDAGLSRAPSAGTSCVSCHRPVHEAAFGTACEQCHSGVRWLGLPDAVGRRSHERTAFPLRGQHAPVECENCHRAELARAERYRGLSYARCADCHADAHGGTLSEHGDCARCHDALGFAPSRVEPALHASLGFALEGGHGAAACNGCHKQPAGPRLRWSMPVQDCHQCHENPHGTQFSREMISGGCGKCHSPKGWGLPAFEHASWPLTGAHAHAACDGCHAPTPADRRAGKGPSYRSAPRSCEGCHDDVHAGQLASAPARSCEFCHQTEQFGLPAFDHALLAGYLLEGKHLETACAECHPSVPLRNGEQVTRWRLGYDQCADCHADPHAGPR